MPESSLPGGLWNNVIYGLIKLVFICCAPFNHCKSCSSTCCEVNGFCNVCHFNYENEEGNKVKEDKFESPPPSPSKRTWFGSLRRRLTKARRRSSEPQVVLPAFEEVEFQKHSPVSVSIADVDVENAHVPKTASIVHV